MSDNGRRRQVPSPVGAAIRIRRRELGLRQDDLAERVERELRQMGSDGFHWPSVSRWERGANTPTGTRLEAVARALECTVADLLGARPTQTEVDARQLAAALASVDLRLGRIEDALRTLLTAADGGG